MPEHKILRGSGDFKGLDRRTSPLELTSDYATDMQNAAFRVSGALNKRKGYHSHGVNSQGSYGMTTYKSVNSTTGLVTDELLMVDTELRKLTEGTITLAYSGSNTAYFSIKLDKDTGTFKFIIVESGLEEVLSFDIGTGFGHSDDKTLAQLKTAIDAVTNFTLTLNGGLSSEKAAFLDVGVDTEIGVSYEIPYKTWTAVTRGDTALSETFTGYKRDGSGYLKDADLENATFTTLNDVVYISNGIDDVMKYDGSKVYRAGLPQPISCAGVGDGTGSGNPDGTYYYKIVYEFTDNQGNYLTSVAKESAAVTVATEDITVTYPNLQTGTGFDIANSNLKIKIYRNKTGEGLTGLFYLITSIANNAAAATSTYLDGTSDATLNTYTTFPTIIKRHDPPPKGRYLTSFQGCLVVSGQRTDVNNVQYSLPYNLATGEIGSEYFPDDNNGEIVESPFGGKITAIASLRDVLFIFHKNSIHGITGDITDPIGIPYRVDLLTTEGGVGCESYATIHELGGNLLFLSDKGIYSISSSGNLKEVSNKVKPLFLNTETLTLKKKRAIGFNWVEENLYVIQLPTESLDVNANQALYTNGGILIAYDYYKDAWVKWTNLDYSGGVSLYTNKIFFNGRSLSSGSLTESILNSMTDTDTTYDFNDHASAINFNYSTNWESLREPTVPKKYLRLKLYAMDTDDTFESPEFTISTVLQKDYKFADLGSISFAFGAGASGGWGLSEWGNSGYGAVINTAAKSKLPSGKCKSLKLRFTNNSINENILITNYEMEIVAPYQMEIKS
ncbi:MAG: hypothetical protein Unbinned8261contig1001_59 [Prokaryotic dsDNA virus sp.]|nr:MAG: hypothetical protein Unbinned8261contig1001_59 [Prokaryotic dsDNA virus sp.]|tara:strand:+ start:7295 stop:9649 length:2355 start_codon:yes stop_codon:yes gene_type:complete